MKVVKHEIIPVLTRLILVNPTRNTNEWERNQNPTTKLSNLHLLSQGNVILVFYEAILIS